MLHTRSISEINKKEFRSITPNFYMNGEKILTRELLVSGCLKYPDNIKKYDIEEGITILGEYLFKDFENIEEIYIPNSVKKINKNCFEGLNKLKSLIIPNSITEIENCAFLKCNIEKIELNPIFPCLIRPDAFKGFTGKISMNSNCYSEKLLNIDDVEKVYVTVERLYNIFPIKHYKKIIMKSANEEKLNIKLEQLNILQLQVNKTINEIKYLIKHECD